MVRPNVHCASLLLLPLFLACSEDPCDEDLVQDLAERCGLQIGVVSGTSCVALSSDQAELTALQKSLCEASDPDLDADCLRNESCEEISAGACADDSGSSSSRDPNCSVQCQMTALDCGFDCGPAARTFEQCSECALDCQEAFSECVDACG